MTQSNLELSNLMALLITVQMKDHKENQYGNSLWNQDLRTIGGARIGNPVWVCA